LGSANEKEKSGKTIFCLKLVNPTGDLITLIKGIISYSSENFANKVILKNSDLITANFTFLISDKIG